MSSARDHLVIREASLADASTIAALITQLGYPATGSEISDRLAYWLPDLMSVVLVAEADQRVIGCLSLHAIPYLERTGRWARIEASSSMSLRAASEQAGLSSPPPNRPRENGIASLLK